jgi:hypothetical protein
MRSLHHQSIGSRSAGSRPNAEPRRQVTFASRSTPAASGARSTAMTSAPVRASSHVQPPGAAPRSRQRSPGTGWRRRRAKVSHSFRYARLGGPSRSSTNRGTPLGNGLEQAAAASTTSRSSSVQEPSGASGATSPSSRGRAATWGSLSAISCARPRCSGAYDTQLRCRRRSCFAAWPIEVTAMRSASHHVFAAHAAWTGRLSLIRSRL